MSKCWECGHPRGAELASCRTCGAPALQTSGLEFECDTCGKDKVGERVVRVTEEGIKTICVGCLLGTDENGDAPRLTPEKERAAGGRPKVSDLH